MFGTDEFGNTRLLPLAFVVVLAMLSLGTVATSQTMWESAGATTTGQVQ